MPLPKPNLDNRRYDQLVNEGRALIPRLARDWTDHNASDPGITLIEQGAWLAEQNIYRFDRLSEEAERSFVRLVGVEPRMPQVASTVVGIDNQNVAGLVLPARLQIGAIKDARFETIEPLFASTARLTAVLTGIDPLQDVSNANAAMTPFAAFGSVARAGRALYLGFDRALDDPGATLSLHCWTSDWQQDAAVKTALRAEETAGFAPHCPARRSWREHYRVSTVWEYYGPANRWVPLADVVDETRALSLSGLVRFAAPANHQPGGAGAGFFIRCRIVRGRFECPPRLLHIVFNAVAAEHALSMPEIPIGTSYGHAKAVFPVGFSPVVAGSVQLRLDDGAGHTQNDWRGAPDFDRAGAHDRVFITDPENGVVHSGDGLRGRLFPDGYQVFATLQIGGGESGNLSAHSLTNVPVTDANLALLPALPGLAQPLLVWQPFAAAGGAPRESLPAAQGRAFDVVTAVDKAVTLADIERLALATPGVPVARVQAVANTDMRFPCYPAPSIISLIVIPRCPRPAPLPSRALLDAIERYLEPRRLVTCELQAMAPSYRRVGVSATLHLRCEVDSGAVQDAALARLDTFLDPLEGGPSGTGWPFGRPVYRSEIMALLAAVPGVARVTGLTLQDGYCTTCDDAGRCDNIELCVHELVVPGKHQLTLTATISQDLTRSDAHECRSTR